VILVIFLLFVVVRRFLLASLSRTVFDPASYVVSGFSRTVTAAP